MMSGRFSGNDVARIWLFRGIADLYFGFHNDSHRFSSHSMFMQIMALEKHLKSVLLFERRAEYDQLASRDAAAVKLNDLAKKLSHRFTPMLDEAHTVSKGTIKKVAGVMFGTFEGDALLKALTIGYEETRYPVPVPAWASHPIPGHPDTYRDPLNSSDTDNMIYSICSDCFRYLESVGVEPKRVLDRMVDRFGEEESLARFQRTYLPDRW